MEELKVIAKDFPAALTLMGKAGFYSWEKIDEAIKEWQEEKKHLDDLEKNYKKDFSKSELAEWSGEVELEDPEYFKNVRERFLEGEVDKINKELCLAIKNGKKSVQGLWEKRDSALRKVYAAHYGGGASCSVNEIEAAKNINFTHFLEVKKEHALCPFHEEKTPSFWVKNNYGYCFGCHWKGDIINFVMEKERLNFPQAIKYLLGT